MFLSSTCPYQCRFLDSKEEAYREFEQGILAFLPSLIFYSTKLLENYAVVFKIMRLFFTSISKQLIMKHDILPSNRFIKLKINFINLMLWLHMNEEVCVVENGIYKQVRTFVYVVYFSCRWFNELILCNSHFSLLQ